MQWSTLLRSELNHVYDVTEGLVNLVQEDELSWKPATGGNWMMVRQLLHHIATSGGFVFKGFITGDWGIPEGVNPEEMTPEEMLPPAEKLPSVASLDEARQMLASDKALAFEMLDKVSEEDLQTRPAPAPWDSSDMSLGYRLLQMTAHINQHKGQLFYYLKLLGKPVNTTHLWGGK